MLNGFIKAGTEIIMSYSTLPDSQALVGDGREISFVSLI
jgi:hypothetical protein